MGLKIAIGAGHTASGKNGCGALGILNESDETRKIADMTVNLLNQKGYNAKLFRIDKGNSYNLEDCYVRAEQVNSWGADLYIEIHLNAFDNPNACGTTSIVTPKASSQSRVWAAKINNKLVKYLGTVDRTNGRGFDEMSLIVLNRTNCPAVLIEPIFCTNVRDCNKYSVEKVSKAIIEAITGESVNIKSTPVKSNNNTNNIIAELQQECNRQGFSNQVVDGIVGPNTLNGCPTLKYGSQGNITKIMQTLLVKRGYDITPDGIFGRNTLTVVKKSQYYNDLTIDGIVGKKTWKNLLNM